ncbi:MAG TPA: hypothetical protein VHQ65_08235 [Thermoanaerobaculia bacterium]|nr:hypothetical protein [Thermoanaerobaculia bacterium]
MEYVTTLRLYLTGLIAIARKPNNKADAILVSTTDLHDSMGHEPLIFWRGSDGLWKEPRPLNRVRIDIEESRGEPVSLIDEPSGFGTGPRDPVEATNLHWLMDVASFGGTSKFKTSVLQTSPSSEVAAKVALEGGALSVHHLAERGGLIVDIDFGILRRATSVVLVLERTMIAQEAVKEVHVSEQKMDGALTTRWEVPSYRQGGQSYIDIVVSNATRTAGDLGSAPHFGMYARLFDPPPRLTTPYILPTGVPNSRQPHSNVWPNLPDQLLWAPEPIHSFEPSGDPGNRPICPIITGEGG